MASEEGVSITISPVQMAAILHKKTLIEGETWSYRLWGGLGIVNVTLICWFRLLLPALQVRQELYQCTQVGSG
ncbi:MULTISPECIES: hypothetical protein [Pseudescherichia]|uniref:hypothetical protein n=1 Tax=Pseudescherichia TaxID=2055880 RepID=UPI001EDD6B46|nr:MULTISPECIES: hypothetical protein [Pseudescherichia]